MKEILSIEGLARKMNLSKNRLYVLAESHRIRPDLVDEHDRAFWYPETADALAKKREAQKKLPRSVRRDYS